MAERHGDAQSPMTASWIVEGHKRSHQGSGASSLPPTGRGPKLGHLPLLRKLLGLILGRITRPGQ